MGENRAKYHTNNKNIMKILFLSSTIWNFYRVRQQLPYTLSTIESNEIIYVEPLRYKDANSIRFKDLSNNPKAKVQVIERSSKLKKGLLLWLYENYLNIRLIIKYKPDAIVSNDHYMSFFPALFCKIFRYKFIFDNMDNWAEVEKNKVLQKFLSYIYLPFVGKVSYAVINTSHFLAEMMGKYNKRSIVIPNAKMKDEIDEFIKWTSSDDADDKMVVNFIGSLRDWYDYELLANVFKEIPELTLHIYGTGAMVPFIEELIKDIPNIALKGSVDSSLVPKLTSQSLFGILPLRLIELNKGTSPIKLFDYWAAGKTVIATPTYEIEKIGKDICVIAEGKEAWLQAIRELINDKKLRTSKGMLGRKQVLERYNYDCQGEILMQLIASK